MSNLTPTAGWDAVPQLETSTAALGGPGGPMNTQAQALLNRTEKLAADMADGVGQLQLDDIGTAPDQIPLNQYLGALAYRETVMVPVPASAAAPGAVGEIAQDGSYLYICTAQDTWKRVGIATW